MKSEIKIDSIYDSYYQHTLKDNITCIGRGLHSGLKTIMSIMPAEANTGYVFMRRDVDADKAEVQARWYNVTDTRLSTTIANNRGTRVSTIEHLLAALHTCGVDNAHIVIDGPEVPIMDGSAATYVALIKQVGRIQQNAERRAIVITKPVTVTDKNKSAHLVPAIIPSVDMTINFDMPVIGKQSMSVSIEETTFAKDIAAARTFGFDEQLETLKKIGLAKGGTLDNAVLIKDNKVVNKEGLRFKNEFVRHKILDCIGDLSLAGAHIVGKFIGESSGHQLNNALLRELMLNEDSWKYTTLRDAEENWSNIISGNPEYNLNAVYENG
jgi:UDP-3-O-[3-hydroxymyristoyl] N-acetylglucosamine deacetylase